MLDFRTESTISIDSTLLARKIGLARNSLDLGFISQKFPMTLLLSQHILALIPDSSHR